MSNSIITVDHLTKIYQLKHGGANGYVALRDVLAGKAKSLLKAKAQNERPLTEDFLALDDVSFSIEKGESVGIIGRNGAGKSTLLKILSRVVAPTRGRIRIEGRMASLLEVGTGFHPELTGRENIFLNGSILGMSREEIKGKFDEIVDFAEVEKFLDTPVKRYSSGMYVRLAFSIAIQLNPEILILDEVLAVGDSVFQKKCIDRMTRIANEGKTIIFVSHNLSAVETLCSKGILIHQGKIQKIGPVKEVIDSFVDKSNVFPAEIDLLLMVHEKKRGELIFRKIIFNKMPVPFGSSLDLQIYLQSNQERRFARLDFGVNIYDRNQNCLIHCSNRFIDADFEHASDRDGYFFSIANNLKPGVYKMTLFLRAEDVEQDAIFQDLYFEIADGNPYGYNDSNQIQGGTFPTFSIQKINNSEVQ
jgi:lipopolysaccharide transport system ATP-binding protein